MTSEFPFAAFSASCLISGETLFNVWLMPCRVGLNILHVLCAQLVFICLSRTLLQQKCDPSNRRQELQVPFAHECENVGCTSNSRLKTVSAEVASLWIYRYSICTLLPPPNLESTFTPMSQDYICVVHSVGSAGFTDDALLSVKYCLGTFCGLRQKKKK